MNCVHCGDGRKVWDSKAGPYGAAKDCPHCATLPSLVCECDGDGCALCVKPDPTPTPTPVEERSLTDLAWAWLNEKDRCDRLTREAEELQRVARESAARLAGVKAALWRNARPTNSGPPVAIFLGALPGGRIVIVDEHGCRAAGVVS